jgi:hypothetical protein
MGTVSFDDVTAASVGAKGINRKGARALESGPVSPRGGVRGEIRTECHSLNTSGPNVGEER